MKLNNKGFTMVEILAAVAILAIMSGIAVAGVTRYIEKAREKSYEAMEKNAYDAASTYIQEKGSAFTGVKEILISDLVKDGYLSKLIDPRDKEGECGGKVEVTRTPGSSITLDTYKYKVTIECPRGYTRTREFDS